jgi:hypothetical protein
MLRILFFLLFFLSHLNAQIKIILVDDLNKKPIANAIILQTNGQFIAKTEGDGSFNVSDNVKEINVSAKNYLAQNIILDNNPIISLKKEIIKLEDVFVHNTKPTKLGFCMDKNNYSDWQTNTNANEYLIVATRLVLKNKSSIENYNFFITSKKNNSPFNFQIYSEKEGFPDKVIYNQYIKDYKKGWNKTELETVLNLEKGSYYIAMQWIPLPDKSDVWKMGELNGKDILASGQCFALGDCKNNEDSDFFFRKKWLSTKNKGYFRINKTSFAHYIEIYEN